MVHDPIKAGGSNSFYRASGSTTFIEAARSGLIVLKDPTDERKRVLAHVKSNLSPQAASLSFSIVSDEPSGDDRSSILWQGECPQTLQELLNPPVFIQSLGAVRQEILSVLEESSPEVLSIKALAEELPEIGPINLRKTLKRMAEDGQIKKSARGQYCALSASSPSPEQESPPVASGTFVPTVPTVPNDQPKHEDPSVASGTFVPTVPNDQPENE
jgi:hypothetical protein